MGLRPRYRLLLGDLAACRPYPSNSARHRAEIDISCKKARPASADGLVNVNCAPGPVCKSPAAVAHGFLEDPKLTVYGLAFWCVVAPKVVRHHTSEKEKLAARGFRRLSCVPLCSAEDFVLVLDGCVRRASAISIQRRFERATASGTSLAVGNCRRESASNRRSCANHCV